MTRVSGRLSFALITALALGAAATAGAAPGAGRRLPPAERMLAGYTTVKHGFILLRDARTGYYLLRQGECDGAHLHLALYRDRTALKGWLTPDLPIKTARLHNVQTGRGVRIGDGPERVRKIMGPPTWQGGSLTSSAERVWSYHRLFGSRARGVEYITLIRFARGRVSAIELDREEQPG